MTLVVFADKVHTGPQDVAVIEKNGGEYQLISGCEFNGEKRISVDDIPWFG